MPPRKNATDTVLLDILQTVAGLRSDTTQLIASHAVATTQREGMRAQLVDIGTNFAVISEEVKRLTPIVNKLDAKAAAGDGAKGVGKHAVNFMVAGVSGIAAAIATLFLHK